MQPGTSEKSQGTAEEHPEDQTLSDSKAWLFAHANFEGRNWLCVSILASKRKEYHVWIQTETSLQNPLSGLARFCLHGFLYIPKCNKMKCFVQDRGRFHKTTLQKHPCLLRNPQNRSLGSFCPFLSCLALAHPPRCSESVTPLLLHSVAS